MTPTSSRRALVHGGLALGLGTALTACGGATGADAGPSPRVLLAWFSRAGENHQNGGRRDLEVGNTEVLARMLADRLGCVTHEIRAADPYPDDYDATVARNVREQDADARPGIDGTLPPSASYDVVLLASPIWNLRPPMVMATFAEALDLSGTTVHPVVTYAVSGLGRAERDYRRWCDGADVAEGLAVRGEQVRGAGDQVEDWLSRIGLPTT